MWKSFRLLCGCSTFFFLGASFWVGRNELAVDELAGFLCFVLVTFGVLNLISDFHKLKSGE